MLELRAHNEPRGILRGLDADLLELVEFARAAMASDSGCSSNRGCALIPAVVLTLVVPSVRGATATALDYLSLKLDDSREVVLEGKPLCRDCPLEKEYSYHAMCPLTGHHGTIVTSGGRIWNILEGEKPHELIHNSSLLGRRVWVEGRMCRKAGSVAVSDYHNLL